MPWAVSIFLSHSGRNSFLADAIFEALSKEAKAQVWYDRARPGGAPEHHEAIKQWLREAIHETQLFVILLTRASVASGWVRDEIAWAEEKIRTDERFRLIVLDAEGVASLLERQSHRIIDCRGLWLGEIFEELHAAVYGRQGRQAWRLQQMSRGWVERGMENRPPGYEHLATDGGVALGLEWLGVDRWRLTYDADGEVRHAAGSGPDEIVDPMIRPGDRVCSTTWQWFRKSIWMRSDGDVKREDVREKYHARIHPRKRPECRDCQHTPLSLSPPRGGAWRWWAILCSLLSMGTAVAVAVSFFDPKLYMPLWPARAAQMLRMNVVASIVVFGTYQLAWSLHNERDFQSVLRPVLWRSIVYPILHYLGVLMASFVIVGGALALTVEHPLPPLAYATIAIYALTLLYALYRLWLFLTSDAVRDAATGTYSTFRYPEFAHLCWQVMRKSH
jgi:hypothetical protein